MPESISHEGYSAKPMHSYWDDLFAAPRIQGRGVDRRVTGHEDDARTFARSRKSFALPPTLFGAAWRTTGSTTCPDASSWATLTRPAQRWRSSPSMKRASTTKADCRSRRRGHVRPLLVVLRRPPRRERLRPRGGLYAVMRTARSRAGPAWSGAIEHARLGPLLPRRPTPGGWNAFAEVVQAAIRRGRRSSATSPHLVRVGLRQLVPLLFVHEREVDDALVLFHG